jgi:uncharacterized cupredoxin-like copper-binding protein
MSFSLLAKADRRLLINPRVLAVLLPVAVLITACASPAAAPSWASGPTAAEVAESPSPTATAVPSVAASVAPSVAPLSGEVNVVMSDTMRFAPEPITVKAGEEITFVVTNEGLIVHEFFVGTEDEQVEHAAEMAAGGMSHGHDNALSLKAGETGSLTMTFADAGSLLIGCHEPGHYDAGMVANLTVVD